MAPVDKMHTPPLDTGGILTRIALTAWKTSDGTGISGPFFRHAGFHKKKYHVVPTHFVGIQWYASRVDHQTFADET